MIADVRIRGWLIKRVVWKRMVRGAIFCQVNKIRPADSVMPWETSGTQK